MLTLITNGLPVKIQTFAKGYLFILCTKNLSYLFENISYARNFQQKQRSSHF